MNENLLSYEDSPYKDHNWKIINLNIDAANF